MLKTFKYRIFPSKKQISTLESTLEECRWLYNHFLSEKKIAWEKHKKSISLYDQQANLPTLKAQRPSLSSVYSQVLQNVSVRIDLAFKAFFRRCKSGEKPGYPRFKGRGWYDSFTYPQNPKLGSPFQFVDDKYLRLAKIGLVKIKLHRKILGNMKTCTVKRSSTGKWYVFFVCEDVPAKKLKPSKKQVGIDVGLSSFAVLSDGERIDNPRFFKQEEKALAKAQRKHSKNKTKKTRKVISRVHERIKHRREDFCHKRALELVEKYGLICVEDLSIKNMIIKGKKPKLSKSISDAAWGLFLNLLSFKAENAGRTVVKVNPAYTTQDCSNC
jgi:putative transposase